jgi:hypothetical protein
MPPPMLIRLLVPLFYVSTGRDGLMERWMPKKEQTARPPVIYTYRVLKSPQRRLKGCRLFTPYSDYIFVTLCDITLCASSRIKPML